MVIDIKLTPSHIRIDQILSLYSRTSFIYPAPVKPRSSEQRSGGTLGIHPKETSMFSYAVAGFGHDSAYLRSLARGLGSAAQTHLVK